MLEMLEDRTVPSAAAAYGQLPLTFEVNEGQAAPQENFLCRGSGYSLALTPTTAVLGLNNRTATDALSLQLVGANPAAQPVGQDLLITRSNYFIGNDSSKWLRDIPNYGRVEYQNVYAGINLVYYGNQGQLEYDFVVSPGADPGAIRLSIQGAQSVSLDGQGDLVLHTSGGDAVEHTPVVYQDVGGKRQSVSGRFVLEGNGQVGFQVGAYDHSKPLVIDPVLVYSTYLGGSGNWNVANGIAVDSSGDAYVTGYTASTNFPTPGAVQTTSGGGDDVFISKLNSSGTALVYSTYLGGSGGDTGYAIALDSAGDAYVTGYTASTNFPTTFGAFQTSLGASVGAFITKLNATGSALVYSTYLAGSDPCHATSIAVDGAGNAYVTGTTDFDSFGGSEFPTTPNAFEPAAVDGIGNITFATKLNASGSALVYSTFLGCQSGVAGGQPPDSGYGIAVDAAGDAYVVGLTTGYFPTTPGAFQPTNTSGAVNGVGYVAELNPAGSALVYSTYLGGSAGKGDAAYGLAVDAAGSAYVTGHAADPDFPTTSGALQSSYVSGDDGFVTKLNPGGSTLAYSTFLPGCSAIALDSSGDAYVTGRTSFTGLPLVNALQGYDGGDDAVVAELNGSGSALLFSTYLGGNDLDVGTGIALNGSGNIYVAGWTDSTNFPTTPGAFQTIDPNGGHPAEAFVAKISLTPLPASPSFAVAGFPSPTTAGVAHTFTVTTLNADGTVNTGYTGTVHFASNDLQAVLPADYTFTAADQGTHTFTAILKTAGSQSITAFDTATGSIAGTESGIVVQPGAATHFSISGPSTIRSGNTFSLVVTALDAYGNVATGYVGTIHFTDSASGATLPGNYTFTATDAGVHTFTGLKLRTKGKHTITIVDTLTISILGTWMITVD
jgi:hypothetical protein